MISPGALWLHHTRQPGSGAHRVPSYFVTPPFPIDGSRAAPPATSPDAMPQSQVRSQPRRSEPITAQTAVSSLHYASSLLRRGYAEDAADVLERIDADPERPLRPGEQRFLGLIYLVLDDVKGGVAQMAAAYQRDADLAAYSLDAMTLPGSDRALRQLVRRAVSHANESPSAEAWFVVAVLMQAQQRNHVALRMLQRVEQMGPGGLPVDQMRSELRRR